MIEILQRKQLINRKNFEITSQLKQQKNSTQDGNNFSVETTFPWKQLLNRNNFSTKATS